MGKSKRSKSNQNNVVNRGTIVHRRVKGGTTQIVDHNYTKEREAALKFAREVKWVDQVWVKSKYEEVCRVVFDKSKPLLNSNTDSESNFLEDSKLEVEVCTPTSYSVETEEESREKEQIEMKLETPMLAKEERLPTYYYFIAGILGLLFLFFINWVFDSLSNEPKFIYKLPDIVSYITMALMVVAIVFLGKEVWKMSQQKISEREMREIMKNIQENNKQ